MKIYILIEEVYTTTEAPYFDVIGAYKDIKEAKKEQEKSINDNLQNFGFVKDESPNEQFKNDTIIFYGYQENWDNYIEYKIIEKEI